MREYKCNDTPFPQSVRCFGNFRKRLSLQNLKCGRELVSVVLPKLLKMIHKYGCYWRWCSIPANLVYFRNRWMPSRIFFHCIFEYMHNCLLPLLVVPPIKGVRWLYKVFTKRKRCYWMLEQPFWRSSGPVTIERASSQEAFPKICLPECPSLHILAVGMFCTVCHSASLQEVRVPYSNLFWWRDPRYGERNAVGQHCFAGTKAEGGKTAYYSSEELERFKGCIALSLVMQQLTAWTRHTIWAVWAWKIIIHSGLPPLRGCYLVIIKNLF